MIVNSRRNERIVQIASLKQKKYRDYYGLYLVEGVKMVKEAFAFGKPVKTVLGLGEFIKEYDTEEIRSRGVEIIEVTKEALEKVSDAVTPQGIVAVLEISKKQPKPLEGISVCLDGVSDCGNLGTILRICACCNVKNVFLINCADVYSPKTVRSSMSGLFLTDVYSVSYGEFESLLGDVPLIIGDMNGDSVFDFETPKNFCLALGSEAHGVSVQIEKLATRTLKIPMLQNMESLNVGVSCGIILYQLLKNNFN